MQNAEQHLRQYIKWTYPVLATTLIDEWTIRFSGILDKTKQTNAKKKEM